MVVYFYYIIFLPSIIIFMAYLATRTIQKTFAQILIMLIFSTGHMILGIFFSLMSFGDYGADVIALYLFFIGIVEELIVISIALFYFNKRVKKAREANTDNADSIQDTVEKRQIFGILSLVCVLAVPIVVVVGEEFGLRINHAPMYITISILALTGIVSGIKDQI
ncbi:MAG: hypothetical protein LBS73_06510, partial [Campylobacteraceae bacterium]|nr:hypothetical protein [Campylobacteraceae bacterium]